LLLNFRLSPTKRLPKKLHSDIKQKTVKYAESQQAQSRIDDMAAIASRQPSASTKTAAKIVVAVISGLTFSAGTQVLTSRLGPAALPAAIVGGALAGGLVDDRATRAITGVRRKHSTIQALKTLEREQQANPPVNDFGVLFYQTQTALVERVESKHLEKQLHLDVTLAGLLSSAEFCTAFWIVAQLGLPGGFLIEAIAATLPVTIIWIAAAVQSEYFELPVHYADVIKKYEPYVFPSVDMSETEVQELLVAKEQEESRMDFLVKYIAQGDTSDRLKDISMAEADYDLNYGRKRKQLLEQERDSALERRIFQYHYDIANIRAEDCPLSTVGLTPQQITAQQQRWVEQETYKLKEVLVEELKVLRQIYA
jgi:hypothetical protein